MKKSLLIIPLALSLVLAGCNEEPAVTSSSGEPSTSEVNPTSTTVPPVTSSSGSTSGSVTPSGVLSVTLNKVSLELDVYTKKSETLVATVEVEGGVSTATKWESSDKNVASVSNGVVSAKSKGTATIKVSSVIDPTKFATCVVSVSDSRPPAALHTAQVKFGTSSFAPLEPMSDAPKGDGGLYQYKLTERDVTGGDPITFKFDGEVVKAWDGSNELEPHTNNTFGNFDDGYVVHNDAKKADICFEVYETGYLFRISGYDSESPDPEPPAPTPIWFLKGTMNKWEATDPLGPSSSKDPNVEKQYAITKYLNVNDEFKFAGPDKLWIGYENIENKNSMLTKSETEDNIVVNAEGNYTFYLKDLIEPVDRKDYLVYVGYPEGAKYIDASYEANVNVGGSIDPTLLTVEFVDGDSRTDIKGEATYKLGDEDFSFDHVFSEAGEYSIDVIYVADEKEYAGKFTVNVVAENSYGLYFSEDKIINLTPTEEKDHEGRDQFYALQVEFKENETFRLINFATGKKFIAPFDEASFGGHISNYVDTTSISEETYYLAVDNFYASVYAKFKLDDDQIYFELSTAPATSATIKVGEAEAEEMDEMTPPFDDPALLQQYEYVVDAVSGMEISFKIDGNDIPVGDNRREGNISVDNGKLTFLYDQEDCHIYLKVYASGYNFYATYDTNFYVAYEGTSWDRDPNFVMTSSPSEDFKEQYRFVWYDLAENTEFKVLTLRPSMGNNGYIGWNDALFEESGDNFEEGSNTNIKCKNTGNYEIFFKINTDDSLAIYINELPEANTLVASYSGGDILKGGTIDASKLTVTYYDDEGKPTDVKEEATYSLTGTAIDIETTTFDTAGTFTIDVAYNSKGASFTIKVVDPTETMELNIYISGDNIGSWYNTDSPDFFVWYWGGASGSHLVKVTSIEAIDDNARIHVVVTIPLDATNCKLFRCNKDASIVEGDVCPDKDDKNVVYNYSDDMTIGEYEGFHYADGNF